MKKDLVWTTDGNRTILGQRFRAFDTRTSPDVKLVGVRLEMFDQELTPVALQVIMTPEECLTFARGLISACSGTGNPEALTH